MAKFISSCPTGAGKGEDLFAVLEELSGYAIFGIDLVYGTVDT